MMTQPSMASRSLLWVIGASAALMVGLSAQTPASPVVHAPGRIFLFFVDDLHLEFSSTGHIRGLFTTIVKRLLHDGDMFAIVSSGPSKIDVDLTSDRSQLDKAIRAITGNALKPADILRTAPGIDGASEVRYRAHVALSALRDRLTALERMPDRRKTVIYVSDGYGFDPFQSARPGAPDADLARELWDLTHAANRINARLYTFAARGIVGAADPGPNVGGAQWSDHLRMTIDTLRVLAEQTGAIAILTQDDVDQALATIDRD